MKLNTPVNLTEVQSEYGHQNRFVCLGSCFASEIGKKLEQNLFDCLTNPLGNLFNPLALCEVVSRAIESHDFEENEFFQHQEIWRHFLVHSSLASTDRKRSQETANKALATLKLKLATCDLLILTLGSAWIYDKTDYSGAIGHNHKLPLESFEKRRLSPTEIGHSLKTALAALQKFNPSLKLCFTVSPVRHTRDGLHENNLSKAGLLLAVDQVITGNSQSHYFPAYELLLDELRDYRYYAEDLAHPNQQAVDYIWEKFQETHLADPSIIQIEEIQSILKMLNHRPHHTDTIQYQSYKSAILKKINLLTRKLPQADKLKESWDRLA